MDSSQTDTELFQALQKGQSPALGVLYNRHSGLVYTIALTLLGDPQEAEALTQEIFLKLWKQRNYRPSQGSLVRFLATLTQTQAVERLRSRQGVRRFLRGWGEATNLVFPLPQQVESLSMSDQRSQQVRGAWAQLPDNQRQILKMAYYGGLSQLDIARQLDIPLETVKYQARQGLLRLGVRLQNLTNEEIDGARQTHQAQAGMAPPKSPGNLAAILPAQRPSIAMFGVIASVVSLFALIFSRFLGLPVNPFSVNPFSKVVQSSSSSISNRDAAADLDTIDLDAIDLDTVTPAVVDLETITPAKTLSTSTDVVWSLALSADGQILVSGGADKTIKVWNLETDQVLHTLSGHTDTVRAIALSPNGRILASGSGDHTIKLWNVETGQLLRTLAGHSGPVWSVAISPDGQTLISGGEDGALKIWRLQTGELIRMIQAHADRVFSVAIAVDGETIATGGIDHTIKLWRLQTGELIGAIAQHSSAVRAVDFSPDGRHLASGSWDKTIKLWNWRTGELIHTFTGHTLRVVTVKFSQDDPTLASGSIDHTIKLWDTRTGRLRQTLAGHSDWVLAVAASDDRLVSSSKDQTIQIWRPSNR